MAGATSVDAICTCKSCDHELAQSCADAECTCCKPSNHSMVMDGMEGFRPRERPKAE